MPKGDSKDTLTRQWEMLKMLPTRGTGLSAPELVERLASKGFGVDLRTVQRDLAKLSKPFQLVCNEASPPYGWRFMEGTDLGIPGLTVAEALTLKMVDEFLAPMLPASMLESLRSRLEQATKKLDALEAADNPAARWAEKIRVVHPAMNMVAPDIKPEVMAILQEGLLRERQLEVAYQRLGAEAPSTHRIHPLALVQRGPIVYLVCTVFDYDDPRLYAVHRMASATLLEDEVKWPEGFSIDSYIQEGHLHFGDGSDISLKLWVDKSLGAILHESPLSTDMNMKECGEGFEVKATVQDTLQLKWWLLSRSREVKVLAPKTLREAVVRHLREALEKYE